MTTDDMPNDWMVARETRCCIAGAAGVIEVLANGVASARALALIAHPHPLHGGSMDNKVVFTLARACRDSGVLALRCNFRGVGRSAGVHDNGVGELEDLRSVLAWARAQLPPLPLLLAGFSFGAALVAQLAQAEACAALLLAAPPVPRYGLDAITRIDAPVLLLQGDDDEVIDSAAVYHWFAALDAPHKHCCRWPVAGHFFHGLLPAMKDEVEAFLSILPA